MLNQVADSVISKVVLTVIRRLIVGWGATLVSQGLITKDQDNQLIGAIMVIVPIGFSIYSTIQDHNAKKGTS